MKKKTGSDFNPSNLFLGLLVGFLLGTTVVYWHSNRQNDRLFTETLDKIINVFSDHAIQLETGDSIILIREDGRLIKTENKSRSASPISPSLNSSVIAQDKLLHTRTISLQNPGSYASNKRLDSMLGKTEKPDSRQLFFIEFWESPLNSIGYKMGKNKVMLYGIQSYDMVRLITFRNQLYLNYFNEYYPLQYTTTFKPLVPAEDPFLSEDMQSF